MKPRITEYVELTKNRHPQWDDLRQIRLVHTIPGKGWIRQGTLGGYVVSADNLNERAWIGPDVTILSDDVRVSGDADINGTAKLLGKAEVKDSAYLSGSNSHMGLRFDNDTIISGSAQIHGNVSTTGDVQITDNAFINSNSALLSIDAHSGEGVRISKHASIHGHGNISGNTKISGGRFKGSLKLYSAKLSNSNHILTVGPIGSENVTARLYRTGELGAHKLVVGCWEGTVQELEAEVEERAEDCWDGTPKQEETWRRNYALLKQLCESTIEGWNE